jgi:hypothetical protein
MPASEQTRGNGGEERGGNPKNLAAVSSSPHLERVDGNTLLPQGGGEQTGLLVQNGFWPKIARGDFWFKMPNFRFRRNFWCKAVQAENLHKK